MLNQPFYIPDFSTAFDTRNWSNQYKRSKPTGSTGISDDEDWDDDDDYDDDNDDHEKNKEAPPAKKVCSVIQ